MAHPRALMLFKITGESPLQMQPNTSNSSPSGTQVTSFDLVAVLEAAHVTLSGLSIGHHCTAIAL